MSTSAPPARDAGLLTLARRLTVDGLSLGGLAARGRSIVAHDVVRVHEQVRLLAAFCRRVCERHGVGLTVRGRPPRRPSVIVANHLGYLDAISICAVQGCIPVAKREVSGWPLIGAAGDATGVMFVERGNANSGARVLRRVLRALRNGVSVLNFPEGTTTDGAGVLAFRRGVFGAARIAEVPVAPVCVAFEDPSLCWIGDDEFMPHYVDFSRRRRSRVHVTFLEPLSPGRFADVESLTSAARERIACEPGGDAGAPTLEAGAA